MTFTDVTMLCERLATHIHANTIGLEDVPTLLPNLTLFRREARSEPCVCRVEPAIVLVVQGAKQLLIGNKSYRYDGRHFIVTSLDMPATSQVLQASREHPCLGLMFKLDLRLIAELIAQSGLPPPGSKPSNGSAMVGQITVNLLEAFLRLLDLLKESEPTRKIIAPLITREIHFRLLLSDIADRLWQRISVGTAGQRVARAVDWLRSHYSQSISIEQLANEVQMSSSNLYKHFKQLTGTTPLQYQKWLRLNEARRLMLNERLDAAQAAFYVGYASASQFSREYTRLFGAPPRRDIETLKRQDRG